jgi:hypothetical protein
MALVTHSHFCGTNIFSLNSNLAVFDAAGLASEV